MAETIDVWIPGPSEEEVYGLRDRGYLLFKDAPAGQVYSAANPSLGSLPSTWPMHLLLIQKLSLRPEEGRRIRPV